jgi:hypothetical protein
VEPVAEPVVESNRRLRNSRRISRINW